MTAVNWSSEPGKWGDVQSRDKQGFSNFLSYEATLSLSRFTIIMAELLKLWLKDWPTDFQSQVAPDEFIAF